MCITALGTGRLVPSSPGRAVTTMTRPAGEDGPASEPRDGWWATSISIRATTQTSSANAPDFFSSLLARAGREHAGRIQKAEIAKWAKVVKEAGLRPE